MILVRFRSYSSALTPILSVTLLLFQPGVQLIAEAPHVPGLETRDTEEADTVWESGDGSVCHRTATPTAQFGSLLQNRKILHQGLNAFAHAQMDKESLYTFLFHFSPAGKSKG